MMQLIELALTKAVRAMRALRWYKNDSAYLRWQRHGLARAGDERLNSEMKRFRKTSKLSSKNQRPNQITLVIWEIHGRGGGICAVKNVSWQDKLNT
jgi:hypothetical protein